MTFVDAEKEIVNIFKGTVSRIQLAYNKCVFPVKDAQCSVIVCYPGIYGKAESFYSSTWQGVINKIRIFLEPIGVPTSEEAPQDTIEGVALQPAAAPAVPEPPQYPKMNMVIEGQKMCKED